MFKPAIRWLPQLVLLLTASTSLAQPLPKSIAIGSNPPGSLFYALASGLAKVISEASPMQAQVQPYAGTSTFVPLFDSGELELGVVNAVDMGMVYQGQKLKVGGRNPFPHVGSSRLIMRGSPLRSSLIVRKDSPIKTIADVKGKRVTGEYPAQLAVWYNVFGSLSNGGLTWNDVKVVPVPAVFQKRSGRWSSSKPAFIPFLELRETSTTMATWMVTT